MGKSAKTALEEVKDLLGKPRTTRALLMKGHRLLETCNKDQPDKLPQVGELVWAKVLGHAYWPGFILKLTDLDNTDVENGAEDIDDSAYGFVMFLEKTYRYAPIAWEQMIRFDELDAQLLLLPEYNKLVVKKSWKMNTAYKTALEMAKEYSGMSVTQRLDKAISSYKQYKADHAPRQSTSKPNPSPVKDEVLPKEAINKVMLTVREKKKSGLRVSDRITKKQIIRLKPKPQPKSTANQKTDKTSVEKAANKNSKVKKNQRPDVGGEILKQWTQDRFNGFSKQFIFDSANHHCTKCLEEITSEETMKSCHGSPYHSKCLVQEGTENPTFKCTMCIEQQCFICKAGGASKTEQPLKCSRCDLRFHVNCLLKDWPQAEIQGSQGPITCPLHFCHTCLGEQKIYGKFRDYTTSASRSYKCRLCLSNYHKNCLPAGCGDTMQGKESIICPKHTLPDLKVHHRRIGCLGCCKQLKQKEEKVDCAFCVQAFHPQCVGYEDEISSRLTLAEFAAGYKCFSCKWGLFPLYGQVVWFQQPNHQYWPAKILYPVESKKRDVVAKRLPGQYSVEYFGSFLFYDNASRALPLQLTTVEIFKTLKVYQDVPKILRAHEEAFFCNMFWDEHRTKFLPPPKPFYKKIERNLYRTVTVQKVREPTDVCPCSEETSELVCQADSGCTNRDMEMECSDRICKGGKRCCNRMFSERKNDEDFLEQKLFRNKGWGVVAKKEFNPGDFVAEYRGEFIDKNEMLWRLSKKEEEDPLYIMEISKEFFIDAEYVGNLSRLINHSCDPNCEVRKYLSLGRSVGGIFARRPIAVGEELTFKYGCGNASTAAFRCRCGAKNCTVFVGKDVPDDFRVEEEPEINQDKWDDVCSKCGFGGSLICCEFPSCGKVWHMACAGVSRKPRQNWCCAEHPERKVAQFIKASEKNRKSNKGKKSNLMKTKKKIVRQSAPAAAPAEVKVEVEIQEAIENETNPGKRKLSASSSPLEANHAPAQKKQRVNSTSMDSNAQLPVTKPDPGLLSPDIIQPLVKIETVRNLRSSKAASPVKRSLIFDAPTAPSTPTTPTESTIDTLVALPKTLHTPSAAQSKSLEGRPRRRANSIPPNGFMFSVPSTPNTRSKRYRRGESLHERSPTDPELESPSPSRILSSSKDSNIQILDPQRSNYSESVSLIEIPRMSRRRSRNSKTAEPFSPLALNQVVKPLEIVPNNQSLRSAVSDDKPIRRGTRSSSISFLASASLNQIHSNGLDSSVKIKKEVCDNGFEKGPFEMEVTTETPRKRKIRAFDASNVTPNGSPNATRKSPIPVKCEVTQTEEEGMQMKFRKPNRDHATKSWSIKKSSPRTYPARHVTP